MSEQQHHETQNVQRLRIRPLTVLEGHAEALRVIQFAPNGAAFVSIDSDIFCLWYQEPMGAWTLRKVSKDSFRTFYADGTLLLRSEEMNSEEDHLLHYSQEGTLLRSFHRKKLKGSQGYDYTPDGTWFFTADCEGHLFLWDHELEHLQASLPLFNDEQLVECPYELCFSPDSQHVFFGSRGFIHRCRVDMNRFATLSFAHVGKKRFSENLGPFEGLALSPLGNVIAGSNTDIYRVEIYTVKTLSLVALLPLPSDELPQNLAFSPDGRMLACAGSKGTVYIWDMQTYQLITTFIAHPDVYTDQLYAIGALAWSPRGDLLVTGGASFFLSNGQMDYSVRLWEVKQIASEPS